MRGTLNYGFKEEAKICSIDAIDRELKRVETLALCKSGMDKCELDRHLADFDAHKKLFDKKVDKTEGHDLISKERLEQIGENQNGLALLEQEIRNLQERSIRLEEKLTLKAEAVFIQYTSAEELGLKSGSETINDLVEAMPDMSMLYMTVGDSHNQEEYPYSFGILQITKLSSVRCSLEFSAHAVNRFWKGNYYNSSISPKKFLGWGELLLQEEI